MQSLAGSLLVRTTLARAPASFRNAVAPLQRREILTRGSLLVRSVQPSAVHWTLGSCGLAAASSIFFARRMQAAAQEPPREYNELQALISIPQGSEQRPAWANPTDPQYKRPWPGVLAGVVLGAFGAVGAWLVKQLLVKSAVLLGGTLLVQALAVMWASYKGWLTLHWEKILDDSEIYTRSKLEKVKASMTAHLPVKAGFAVGFTATLCWGLRNERFHRYLGWAISPISRAQLSQF